MKQPVFHIISIAMLLPMISCQNKQASDHLRLAWEEAGQLPASSTGKPHPGLAGAISGVHNHFLLVAGGANFPGELPWEGGTKTFYTDIFIGETGEGAGLQLQKTGVHLPGKVAYAAVAATPSGIVYAGGENETGMLPGVFLLTFDPAASRPVVKALKPLPVPTTQAAAFYMDNQLFIAGGETANGATDAVWVMNLNDSSAGWRALPPLPQAASNGVLAAHSSGGGNATLYFAGGRCRQPNGISQHFRDVYKLSMGNTSWEKCDPLPYGISAASGVTIPDGKWLIFSGDKGSTFEKVERLLVQISNAKDSATKSRLLGEKAAIQINHPGFSSEVWMYDFKAENWSAVDSIPYEAPVTTNACFYNNKVYLSSGEIRAGVRTPFILSATIIHEKQ